MFNKEVFHANIERQVGMMGVEPTFTLLGLTAYKAVALTIELHPNILFRFKDPFHNEPQYLSAV